MPGTEHQKMKKKMFGGEVPDGPPTATYVFNCSAFLCSKWQKNNITATQAANIAAEHEEKKNKGQTSSGSEGEGVVHSSKKDVPQIHRDEIIHDHRCEKCGAVTIGCTNDTLPHLIKCPVCARKNIESYQMMIVPPSWGKGRKPLGQ